MSASLLPFLAQFSLCSTPFGLCELSHCRPLLRPSLKIFQRQGIDAIPAPTDFLVSQSDFQELGNTPKAAILNLLPDSNNLHIFTNALKEYIGTFVYRLRGWL